MRANRRAALTGLWWLVLGALTVLTWRQPIRGGELRLALLVEGAALWLSLAILLRRRRAALVAAVGLPLLAGAWLGLPGRPIETATLRADYVRCLLRYEHTPFVWGGETPRGLDCSGLVRRAMVDALWRQGLRRANPRSARASLSLWWHDSSARALGEGYRGLTRDLGDAPSVNAADHRRLWPGDLAVLGGTHVMAYLGDQTWIEADPSPVYGDRVVRQTVPTVNPWFGQPARLVRWTWLNGP